MYFCGKYETMDKMKSYREQKTKEQNVGEPMIAYTNSKKDSTVFVEMRDDVRRAISGEELLSRLRPRIKTLF